MRQNVVCSGMKGMIFASTIIFYKRSYENVIVVVSMWVIARSQGERSHYECYKITYAEKTPESFVKKEKFEKIAFI